MTLSHVWRTYKSLKLYPDMSNASVHFAGFVRCWGEGNRGQATVPHYFDLGPAIAVAAGDIHSCVLMSNGTVGCWGLYWTDQPFLAPPDLGPATNLAAGVSAHRCAVMRSDRTVRCWGLNDYGQATVPLDLGAATTVATGQSHTCAVLANGTVSCWGQYVDGRTSVPYRLPWASGVAAGGKHTCIVTIIGTVRCWGRNDKGQAEVPTKLGPATAVSAGAYHTCAVVTDNRTVRCWGWNDNIQGSVPDNLGPVTAVSGGLWHTCVIMAYSAACTNTAQEVFNATCVVRCPAGARRNTTTGVCGEARPPTMRPSACCGPPARISRAEMRMIAERPTHAFQVAECTTADIDPPTNLTHIQTAAGARCTLPTSDPPHVRRITYTACTNAAQEVFNATCVARCPVGTRRNATTGVCGMYLSEALPVPWGF